MILIIFLEGKWDFLHLCMLLLKMSLNLVSIFEVVPPPWTPSSDGGRFLIFSFDNQSFIVLFKAAIVRGTRLDEISNVSHKTTA